MVDSVPRRSDIIRPSGIAVSDGLSKPLLGARPASLAPPVSILSPYSLATENVPRTVFLRHRGALHHRPRRKRIIGSWNGADQHPVGRPSID